MTTAVIVDAVRTAGGKRNGKLRNWHAVDLASEALKALAERNKLDPALVDDVIMGCVMQVSEQSLNIGPQRGAGRGLARVGARDDDRPPVRVVPAGHPLRRPGRDGRRLRHRGGGRRREHDPHPDGLLGRPRLRLPLRPAHDGPLQRRDGPQPPAGPGHRGRDDRRPVGHLARRARRLLGAEPPAGGPGHGRGPLRERDRPGAVQRRRGQRHRRALARPTRASAPTPPSRRWPT